MFNFDMHIEQNFASFKSDSSDAMIFVDSFDNKNFDVRAGTATSSHHIATICASSSDDLNDKLSLVAMAFVL